MALTWDWKPKYGEIWYRDTRPNGKDWVANIYVGNAPLIAIQEWEETDDSGEVHNMYAPYLFFCDDGHAKRCLGLAKGATENLYAGIFKIRLSQRHPNYKKIMKWFLDAFDSIIVEHYDEKEEK